MQQFIKDSISENSLASSETEKSIDYQSVLTRVQQIADKLPEKQRNIFRKSRQEGKSSKEIAEELSLSPGTVDNYISEALKFIRRRLVSEDIAFLLFFSSFCLSSTGY